MTFAVGRPLRGLVAMAGAGSLVLLVACNGDDKRPAASPAATTQAGAIPLPPTATPRPAKLVVEPEPSFVPAADASRTLVLRSGSTSLAVDTDSGAVREIMRAPQAFDYGSYSFPAQFPFVFSPDGGSYAFACDDSGARPKEGYLNNLCLSRAGSPSAEIVARRGPLEAFGAYTPNAIQWSPDGRRIAFRKRNRDNAEVSDVYVVELTTLATTRVITNAGHESWGPAAWSPDGTRFIIQRLSGGPGSGSELLAFDASTGESLDLAQSLPEPKKIPQFAWSPDGREVAFGVVIEQAEPYEAAVFVVDAAGGSVRKVMDGPIAWFVGQLAWSPDGRWIAVTLAERAPPPSFRFRVFVVRADGSEERALPDEVTDSTGPVWAPDSSHLALRGVLQGRPGIIVASIRGATPVLVSGQQAASYPGFLGWSADGKRLFFTEEGGCGQGGCTPGFLYVADLESGGPPRKLYGQAISDIVNAQPE